MILAATIAALSAVLFIYIAEMKSDRYFEISTELSNLLTQQTEFFGKDDPTPAELQEFKQAGERIRKLFAALERAKVA